MREGAPSAVGDEVSFGGAKDDVQQQALPNEQHHRANGNGNDRPDDAKPQLFQVVEKGHVVGVAHGLEDPFLEDVVQMYNAHVCAVSGDQHL